MMYKKRGDMMKMIRKNSIRLLSTAALIASVMIIAIPSDANEIYIESDLQFIDDNKYDPTPTLDKMGLKSDYNLEEFVPDNIENLPNNSIVNYELKNVIKSDNYIKFNDKELIPHYYNISINNNRTPISNTDIIDFFTGDIINSHEINNAGTISNVIGDFINNTGTRTKGGAIYNTGTITNIKGNFINNFTTNGAAAIESTAGAEITNIDANFINNSAKGSGYVVGAAIENGGHIGTIKGNFIGNRIWSNNSYASGGAIRNNGTIDKIEGNFIGNKANGNVVYGAVLRNDGIIKSINANFIRNIATSNNIQGGVIRNNGTIDSLIGNFIENEANGGYASAINNGKIGYLKGNFIRNKSISTSNIGMWGATLTITVTGELIGNFIENGGETDTSTIHGGVLSGSIGTYDESTGLLNGGIVNSNFIANYAKTKSGDAKGGAIYTSKDLNIIADNGSSTFSGNYTQVGDEKDDNAIYMDNADASLNFQLKNGGSIVMKDNIRGLVSTTTETSEDGTETTTENHYTVNIQGDDINKTTFYLHNDIYDANVTLGNTTLNTINDEAHTYNFHSLRLTDNTNMSVDVDLAKGEMDRFSAKEYGEHNGNLNVVGMNLLSDAKDETTEIMFAEAGLKDNVTNGTPSLPNKAYQTAYTPIYKYDINYDNRTDGGYFVFTRGGKNGGSDSFNPSVLSAPVSSVAASQATINETFKYVFEHADTFTQMPNSVRQAKLNANKYALSTDFNNNNGDLCKLCDSNNKAGWFKPYVTFENMNLKHGPKVDAITYGSLVGFDTDFRELKHGWHSVGTGYIGYNGSQLNYSGVDTTMNGGLLGYTETFYKNNFWTALTLSAGASVGESKTMYGKEDFTSLMAGVGSKTGYNFEFKEGKYILQPIMFMSYTFVNTFDYTNASGVKVKPSPAHSIQLNPSVRFIANTKNGWQPYASVGMVWNVMNENKVTANNVRLPEMGMKPYVEYGLGLQRNWKDKFTAYGQAMIRNGGRNGIALTGGMRWALGKEGKPVNEKVNTPNGTKTVLKQLSPSQKTALGKSQNTTRTTNNAVIKSL